MAAVPELAARAHVAHLDHIIARAADDAGMRLADLDATGDRRTGLIGGVLVGLTTGKALSAALGAAARVNHLEAHALTARLTDAVRSHLMLLVSGGHSQFVLVRGVGSTSAGDDHRRALGEAFDKVAKLLGPGLPAAAGRVAGPRG